MSTVVNNQNDITKNERDLIPQTWRVKVLSETMSLLGGNAFKSSDTTESGIRWLKIANVGFGKIEWRNTDYLPNNYLGNYPKYVLAENDIVMALTRPILGQELKIARIRKNDVPALLNQRVAKLIPNDGYSMDFLYYLLSKRSTVVEIENTIAGTDPPNLGFNDLKKIKVIVPTNIKEQQKLATILSTWDKAIDLKEKLIEQKKRQEKGLMQKLLTGKVRLPGFEGDWQEITLGKVGKTYNGLSGKTAKDFGEGKPYIPYKTIFADSKIDIEKIEYVSLDKGEKQNNAKFGDVFFTTSSEIPNEVGMSSVLLDSVDEFYLNSFCFGFRLNNFDTLVPEFARFFLRSDGFRSQMYRLAQGSTRFNISKSEVMKISINIPGIDEQKEIASILFHSDKEIKLLEEQVREMEKQKKGLMQLLLTGKVRVKV